MWTTTSSNTKIASTALVLGAMCFNTHAAVDVDSIVESQYDVIYSSNIHGHNWSSVGITRQNKHQQEQSVLGMADIVAMVKVSLGLPNKDIARIFGVSRQTLHAYKNSTDEHHTVNASKKERALTLSEIIKEIQPKFARSPGAMAKNYMMDGKSLLDLLSEPELNITDIVRLADNLAEKMSSNAPKATPVNEISLHQLTPVA
ncbi:hypothetical protein RRK63_004316 [Vibrio fluvialis]|nr:hypothetical protein [Vibrio fluvialis]